MRRALFICLSLFALCGASPAKAPYHSLAREFARFHDETATMPQAARAALFRKRFDRLLPGFYQPAFGQTDAQFDRQVTKALDGFAAVRPQYEKVERDFPAAYAQAIAHFQRFFPGFEPLLPVWFIHSLGRMDGGTREVNGKTVMIFGADVIARIHSDGTIGPFLDHELFHVENGQWFKDCAPDTTIWCGLWQEGGATYAASQMNPGASDHMLMLDQPRPIRTAVDANWRTALCTTRRDFDASSDQAYSSYFLGNAGKQGFPPRWGYYVGYRLMQRIGKQHSLSEIDHMDHQAARAALTAALDGAIAEAGGMRVSGPLTGGCRCGASRYTIAIDTLPPIYCCHCLDCQSGSGSAFAEQGVVFESTIAPSGEIRRVQLESGDVTREMTICSVCYSVLYTTNSKRPMLAIVRVGTLDRSGEAMPRAHIWVKRKQAWIGLPDGVPTYEENAPPEEMRAILTGTGR